MKLMLACANGMSTSMLVKRIQESAQQRGIELSIDAVPVSDLAAHIEGVQLILLGPQVSYLEEDVSAQYPDIPVRVIDMMDYGMMNGEKVFSDAIAMLES